MKVLVTADLHFDIARSREPTMALAARICATPADALLIVGDLAGADLEILEACLREFAGFDGVRMFVAGNHDVWTRGESSLHRYEEELPRVAAGHGFHYLDHEPLYLDDVAFVGTMGWYDYQFAPRDSRMPMRFYENKISPAAAERLSAYHHLVEGHDDVTEEMRGFAVRWMDGEHVRFSMSDREFCDRLVTRFRAHLHAASRRAAHIVAAVHHLPFEEFVTQHDGTTWPFVRAFMGSPRFGEALLETPAVGHVFVGHSHLSGRFRKGALTCVNVGSTYSEKRLEVLNIESSGSRLTTR